MYIYQTLQFALFPLGLHLIRGDDETTISTTSSETSLQLSPKIVGGLAVTNRTEYAYQVKSIKMRKIH